LRDRLRRLRLAPWRPLHGPWRQRRALLRRLHALLRRRLRTWRARGLSFGAPRRPSSAALRRRAPRCGRSRNSGSKHSRDSSKGSFERSRDLTERSSERATTGREFNKD
jgi:hypothetical protein